ncbi:hypothetical protein IV38_GL000074 [Lactobacillus selangorensis]|uniref:PIN domain containing protein n=1 Tax=Lactobacillus selangorensis TaxID=81857 RepID=A0A0R2FVC4_9LACO|nr:NYN domain-containing protein [Lactobacillus selangorensis]KRN29194.1 hypothetical protein IV38_GL000074 [Lactobacillus selangorensis]KRN31448.1 hypothetical protein IV40_GL001444 [Lactobacillus selangorensis]
MKKQYLIVDGYNVIGNWPQLKKLKESDHLAAARDDLLHILSEYRKYEETDIIVVFDAMYVPGITQRYDQYNLQVVFTSEDETADSYIEKLAEQLSSRITQVTVVTSDQAEQWTVFSRGALRISSHDFYREVQRVKKDIQDDTKRYYDHRLNRNQPWNNQQLLLLEKIRDQLSNKKD